MIETSTYLRKPFSVEAVRVTEENIADVAEWCAGELITETDQRDTHIKINVLNARTKRQTEAFVGDWVLQAGVGFKIYTDHAFNKAFDPADPIEKLKKKLTSEDETVEDFREDLKEAIREVVQHEEKQLVVGEALSEVPVFKLPADAKLFLMAGEVPTISPEASEIRRSIDVVTVNIPEPRTDEACPEEAYHTDEENPDFTDANGHGITPERWLELETSE